MVFEHWTCKNLTPEQIIVPIDYLSGSSSLDVAYSLHRRQCGEDCVLIHLGVSENDEAPSNNQDTSWIMKRLC